MAAVCPAGPEPMMTTLECIFRDSNAVVERVAGMDESPAAAWFFCLEEAVMAMGTAKAEVRKEDEALFRVEANSLAAGDDSRVW